MDGVNERGKSHCQCEEKMGDTPGRDEIRAEIHDLVEGLCY